LAGPDLSNKLPLNPRSKSVPCFPGEDFLFYTIFNLNDNRGTLSAVLYILISTYFTYTAIAFHRSKNNKNEKV